MDPIRPKFFESAFEIEHGGNTLSLRGLISPLGITKIFLTAGMPEIWKSVLGKTVNVKFEQSVIRGVLLQQFVEHGTFLEIKFRDLSVESLSFLERKMSSEGVSPGWQRKYPRIPVKGYEDPELPVPNLCMVRFVGQEIFVSVMNFTLGGMRIETLGDNLDDIRVGSVLHFDLVTTTGEILANLSAEVRNIAVHDHKTGDETVLTRSFGLRFLEMDPANERKYRNLIRTYCEILRKRLMADQE